MELDMDGSGEAPGSADDRDRGMLAQGPAATPCSRGRGWSEFTARGGFATPRTGPSPAHPLRGAGGAHA